VPTRGQILTLGYTIITWLSQQATLHDLSVRLSIPLCAPKSKNKKALKPKLVRMLPMAQVSGVPFERSIFMSRLGLCSSRQIAA